MNRIITLTGPSCSGKTTLLNELINKHGYTSIVSHTTRPMRPGEVTGVDYHYISQDFFDIAVKSGGFMESISFNGYSYGVSVDEMAKATKDGKIAVLIVEPIGLTQIKKYCINHKIPLVSVYINGELEKLIARYVNRLEGEKITPEMAARHAKRISSLINEHANWRAAHAYDLYINKFEEDNQQQVIQLIKEIDFK